MRGLGLVCVLCALAPVARADLMVMIRDGDPLDRVLLRNTGACALTGVVEVDFSGSKGQVVIDTAYGGLGSRDPMQVEVEHGPVKPAPVADGTQRVVIALGGLAAQDVGAITFDMDNQTGWWEERRVVVTPSQLRGTEVILRLKGKAARAVFRTDGKVTLPVEAPQDCDAQVPDAAPFATVPMG